MFTIPIELMNLPGPDLRAQAMSIDLNPDGIGGHRSE